MVEERLGKRRTNPAEAILHVRGIVLPRPPPPNLFFLLEEGLEYGLVVPFPAYGFASLVSHNENLNSPTQAMD